MKSGRRLLVLIAALFALMWQPVAIVSAAEPQTTIAAAATDPCPACPDMQHGCTKGCKSCDGTMLNCRVGSGCAPVAAVETTGKADCAVVARTPDAPPVLTELHGRSIKPETHPPSPLDQQA